MVRVMGAFRAVSKWLFVRGEATGSVQGDSHGPVRVSEVCGVASSLWSMDGCVEETREEQIDEEDDGG